MELQNQYNIKKNVFGKDISAEVDKVIEMLNEHNLKPLIIILSGSYLYGTNTETSDIDIRGVFLNNNENILSDINIPQVSDKKNDITLTELSPFLVQLYKNSPNSLEIMFAREECILYVNKFFKSEFLDNRDKYLSQLIVKTYGDYNISQIKKSNNSSSKQNYKKKDMKRLPITEFIKILYKNEKVNFNEYLNERGMYSDLVALTGDNTYMAYYDWYKHYERKKGLTRSLRHLFNKNLKFKGIAKENSNDVRKTEVPKLSNVYKLGFVVYNQIGYSRHCDEYNSYIKWKENANQNRFVNIDSDKDVYDGKNMLHSIRCSEMFEEMMLTGTLTTLRPNREFLLSVKKGEPTLESIHSYTTGKFTDEYINKLKTETNLPQLPKGNINHELLNFREKYGNF